MIGSVPKSCKRAQHGCVSTQMDGSEWQGFMNGTAYTNVLQDLHR